MLKYVFRKYFQVNFLGTRATRFILSLVFSCTARQHRDLVVSLCLIAKAVLQGLRKLSYATHRVVASTWYYYSNIALHSRTILKYGTY